MSQQQNFNYANAFGAPQQQQSNFVNDQNFPSLGGVQPAQQAAYQPFNYQPNFPAQQWGQPMQAQGFVPQAGAFVPQTGFQQPVAAPTSQFAAFNLGNLANFNAGASSFNPSSGGFVPKSKQAAGGEFPALGGGDNKTQAAPAKKKDEDEDPCKGKPTEFFIYDLDPNRNVCICTEEQMKFIAIHYPEHYSAPIDILMWLYDMAEWREAQKQ